MADYIFRWIWHCRSVLLCPLPVGFSSLANTLHQGECFTPRLQYHSHSGTGESYCSSLRLQYHSHSQTVEAYSSTLRLHYHGHSQTGESHISTPRLQDYSHSRTAKSHSSTPGSSITVTVEQVSLVALPSGSSNIVRAEQVHSSTPRLHSHSQTEEAI